LLALPANLIAIPLSTFISLPLAFAALIGDLFSRSAGEFFWRYADNSLDWLWRYLFWLQQHGTQMIWHPRGIDNWICAGAALAAMLLLLPRSAPGKLFAPIFLVPLFAPPLTDLGPSDCAVTVIDVGQGLSVLIETARHNLLYDTGPPFGPERTVADLTVIPVLHRFGVAKLDTVMISHNDSDHSGGWPAIVREFTVSRLLMGEKIMTADTAPRDAQFCRAGMHWRWDDVDFDVLYPPPEAHQLSANNHSCVLQISAGDAHILLTGDIERDGENRLLDAAALRPATLLLAPHHGSRSSSTPAFIERVHPEQVVFSTGYLNRFKHPNAQIVERYRQSGAQLFNTAVTGAVTFAFKDGHVARISAQRSQQRHYWD
jgi:competence protein ComEC